MRNGITSRRNGESLGPVIYALLGAYLQPGTTEANLFSPPVFAPLPPRQEPRPTLRVHARHALRLGRSISANGDYIFQPGTHPTSDVNRARRCTPRRYFPYSLLIALARISRSRLRARNEQDILTMIVMVPSRNCCFPFSQISPFSSERRQVVPTDFVERRDAKLLPDFCESSEMETS